MTHEYRWTYDAIGRLVVERYDKSGSNVDDFESHYLYDLVGNRLEKRTDNGLTGSIDEVVVSFFDENDRILNEKKFLNGSTTASEATEYQWGSSTSQTLKTVTDHVKNTITYTEMSYNLQGRLSEIVITVTNSQGVLSKITQTYTYDASGIR